MSGAAAHLAGLYGPLVVIGFIAAWLRVLARTSADLEKKKRLTLAWILVLLVGAPLWLFAAATLGL